MLSNLLIYALSTNQIILIIVLALILGVAAYYFVKLYIKDRREMKEAKEKADERSQKRRERRIKIK